MADKGNGQDTRDEFHRYAGEAIHGWADLERSYFMLIEQLLGVDQHRARIVAASFMTGRNLRQFVARLAETYMNEQLLLNFRKLIKRAEKLSRSRNTVAHAAFHVNPDGNKIMSFRDVFNFEYEGGKSYSFENQQFSLNRLKNLVKDIEKLHNDFTAFIFLLSDGQNIYIKPKVHRDAENTNNN